MHLRYNERAIHYLRSTDCSSGDGKMVDIMGIVDEKIDLIASFMPIGTV